MKIVKINKIWKNLKIVLNIFELFLSSTIDRSYLFERWNSLLALDWKVKSEILKWYYKLN